MSFLGSIGTLMEGSGMRTALKSLYAPVTVGHMMTGKAYSRAIWGRFLSVSSLLSILMVEFWTNLEHEECKMIENIFDNEDPSTNQNRKISTKYDKWYENKNSKLSKLSRTCNCCSPILSTYLLSMSLPELKEKTTGNHK